jgi:branched-chain amino acid transport system permease protein
VRVGRLTWGAAGGLACVVLLVAGGLLYGGWGAPTRDVLVTQMLINAIMVVGVQIYVGNTGVLSFGHMGFGAIAGYTFALLAVDPSQKVRVIPDAPFGMTDAHLGNGGALAVAVVVTVVVGAVVGLGLARSGARSGAVAATVITLALLAMTHEVASTWDDLTAGRNGIAFKVGGTLQGRGWIYLTLLVVVVVAVAFRASRTGRLAQAAREDDLAARAMGVDPVWPQLAALLLSVAVVAVAASLRTWQLGTVGPNTFFFDYTLLTLAMLIVGGRNSVTGALIGVAVITIGNETTRYLAGPSVDAPGLDWLLREGLTDIFLGGAMLLFMIFRPKGLVEDWELGDWLARRFRRGADTPPERAPAVAARGDVELVADGLGVTFGGFRALAGASLTASRHEVVGLIGPNGAGKTTLLNVVTGLVPPTEGTYAVGGVSLAGLPPYAIARAGLARTFQNLRLFPALSVRENVEIVGLVADRHRAGRPRPTADQLLVQAGLWEHRDRRARELDYGNARRLELARAAALAPDFLLLDEPTSGMSDTESMAMIDQVRGMAALIGAGVVVIDHDLGFITGICDRIACLDQGEIIATGTADEVRNDPRVMSAYLGTQP